jgi:Flp pilus assembly protein TadB
VDHRVHHRLHRLTKQQPPRNPLRSEQDAFAFLVWVGGVALVVALAARFAGVYAALPLLVVGGLAIGRFYFGAGGPRRRRRRPSSRRPGPRQ